MNGRIRLVFSLSHACIRKRSHARGLRLQTLCQRRILANWLQAREEGNAAAIDQRYQELDAEIRKEPDLLFQ